MLRLKRLGLGVLTVSFALVTVLIVISEYQEHLPREFHNQCKDWNDYEYLIREKLREGPGEQGRPVELTDPSEIELNEKLYNQTGFAVVKSDKISVNRSILDGRPTGCELLKYPRKLPKVSVIVIFHNEVKSILLRTIHSIVNRTPDELLHEVILVNDKSSNAELYEPLKKYVRENFSRKVKIKDLAARKGLIVTRLEGARIATGEVLVFFDSHIEVGYNWLPPLLDPISKNRRLATVPTIDDFDPQTFNVWAIPGYGERASIDWNLIYRRFERYLPEGVDPIKPFPTPIMLGCAFAIDRKFFLDELGGYDEEFRIWNGENYELSFKLWLCADGLYEVPCSRVTHSFRMINPSRKMKEDYVARNFKRLAEVWMDDYKDIVYEFDPGRYENLEFGDITKQKALRERLKCKPFSYFINEISPDMLERYPPYRDKLPVFASGQIRSLEDDKICIDMLYRTEFEPIGVYYCEELDSRGLPPQSQFFRLTFMKNIVFGFMEYCLDSYKMSMPQCSYTPYGNQYWRYDHKRNMIINSFDDGADCLTGDFANQSIKMAPCDETNEFQKWFFTYENRTALDDWNNIYGYHKFMFGSEEVNREKMMPLEYERCK